ncbi:MAG TPA: glycosyltransferase family 2 protein [Methanocellaceae archaeon]
MRITDLLLMLPTLNEEDALRALGKEIPGSMDVLVVDGGSTDGTQAIAEQLGYAFLPQKFGRGKGCGVRTGMEYFLKGEHSYLGMIDADYTNDPVEIDGMLGSMKNGGYDIVLGKRDRKKQLETLGRFALFINTSTSGIVTFAYRMYLPDIQTGYWLFSRSAVKALMPHLTAGGFNIEYDIVFNAWNEGLKVGAHEVTFRQRLGRTKFTKYLRLKQIYYGLGYVRRSLGIMFMNKIKGRRSE